MTEYTEREIIRLIKEDGLKPDWGRIGGGDEFDHCETCGGKCEWPPTGEPAGSVCVSGCRERISNVWNNHLKQTPPPPSSGSKG